MIDEAQSKAAIYQRGVASYAGDSVIHPRIESTDRGQILSLAVPIQDDSLGNLSQQEHSPIFSSSRKRRFVSQDISHEPRRRAPPPQGSLEDFATAIKGLEASKQDSDARVTLLEQRYEELCDQRIKDKNSQLELSANLILLAEKTQEQYHFYKFNLEALVNKGRAHDERLRALEEKKTASSQRDDLAQGKASKSEEHCSDYDRQVASLKEEIAGFHRIVGSLSAILYGQEDKLMVLEGRRVLPLRNPAVRCQTMPETSSSVASPFKGKNAQEQI